jgi:hypothetical protein
MLGWPGTRCLVGVSQLALYKGQREEERLTEIHDVISADGAVVDDDIPGPECNGVPLLLSVLFHPLLYRA